MKLKIARIKELNRTLDELTIVGKLTREELLRKINGGNGSRKYCTRIVLEVEPIDTIEARCEIRKISALVYDLPCPAQEGSGRLDFICC